MDNENKNDELLDVSSVAEEENQPEPADELIQEPAGEEAATELNGEKSVEDQTVERIDSIRDEIDADQLTGIPVTPFEGDSDNTESDERELCVMCGQRPAEKEDLCNECRQMLTKTRLSFASILILILIVCVGFFGLMMSAAQVPTLQAVSDAYEKAGENHIYSAANSLSSVGNIGWKTARRSALFLKKGGYLSAIKTLVENYFYDAKAESETKLTWVDKVGKANLNAPWNKEVKTIYSDYITAIGAYEKYYAFISEYDEKLYYGEVTPEDVPYDDLIKKFEDAKKTEKSTENLAFISYLEGYLAKNCEKDADVQLAYMREVKEIRPDYTWLYLTGLTELLVGTGNYDEAEECCQQMMEINADDYYGEYYRAMILRQQGKYDEAIALMDKLIETYKDHGFYMAYYEAAVNAFLKDDIKAALKYIKPCFDGEYLNYTTANFYALLCKLNNDETEFQSVLLTLNQNQAELSPTVEKYLNKEITAEEMFNGSGEPFELPEMESEASQES